jgi:hypothetical protein
MNKLYQVLSGLSDYRSVIGAAVLLVSIVVVSLLIATAVRHLQALLKAEREQRTDESLLRNMDYEELDRTKKASTLRNIVAPDGIDPGPNSYTIINDGGEDVYVRTLTIVTLPRRDKFAQTFSGLLDFPDCTSSVFISPISEESMIHKMDRHITVLTSEDYSAQGDVNRQRKLRAQIRDAANFAEQVENGENRFFNVGFLFSLKAKSVAELNKMTSQFKALAAGKSIAISSCFAVQAEAYAQNAPLNNCVVIGSRFIKAEAIKWFQMDKLSVSAIYNYTQSSYSHQSGIALGRDMFTAAPVLFDLYHGSHDGYTLIIAGKTRSGKSATIKMMCSRQLIHGYHFVAIDSQERKGLSEGEYAALAKLCDGVNFKIRNNSDEIMNIFEISETATTIKSDDGRIERVRTLEVKDKIQMVVNILLMMVRGGADTKDKGDPLEVYIKRILTDNAEQMYTETFGIRDGDPDSLYTTPGNPLALDRGITTGRPAKRLPTITDFYKQVLIANRDNKDDTLREAFNVILMGLQDYVKELYYSKKTVHFFKPEEVKNMRFEEGGKGRVYINDAGDRENVVEIHGIRSYYDGQSSIHISKDCPFTNIDISGLNEKEKDLARQVAVDFVNENFIKKNSDDLKSADKLVVICDECHEMYKNQYTLDTLNNAVRTARKRFVGIVLSSQTLREYERHDETKDILTQAAVKFIFKQDYTDKDYLQKALGLTANQVNFIVNSIGGNLSDEEDGSRHRGEMCIIDNKQVCFCKVDYRKDTEAYAVETDAAGIEELFSTAV